MHRSYSISGIADTRDPLQVTRFARNPRIARVCADLHFGQELGEGIRRMFEEMRLAGLADPDYRQTSGSVRLTLSSAAVDQELEARAFLPALATSSGSSGRLAGQVPVTSSRPADVPDRS